ncbi:Cold shock-like protein [Serratia liquefaciens]|jgi:cold shock CspA family protein|uniref:Cold shock domain-containing protein n=1 Tax=Serratia liquefaciens TaxID=614 RepID=A0A379ZZH8_SERLI|nr:MULTISPECIES: cold shock domain-containing protein [Serratia]AKE13115.1 cold-shock protein [Serratia liquefaciens]AMH02159.1 cold shock domain-containing protein [Serratia liquefaciens]AYO36644.1 cold shock domain-containing protein [Serratia sp. P2ACOL2]MBF8103919.1 cold shock domain-containing protein [Serratia liquefaciens]MBI6160927.1 cold shock domain-containing protein [Serratia liquefaciens]
MNGKITTFFEDKGFGFITDENGENRYFHVIKVQNPELIKKNAAVTFEPTNNTKGPSAFAVKVLASSKYIIIANERIKITSIKSFNTFTKEVPVKADVDKENTVLSVGLLMNRIRPQSEDASQTMQTLRMLTITTFQNDTHTFSEHEIDMDETLKVLKSL